MSKQQLNLFDLSLIVVSHRMLRLYTGLGDPDYLIRDLEQVFIKMG